MEYGSIFGHGGYLGPDFTANYLDRAANIGESLWWSSADIAREQSMHHVYFSGKPALHMAMGAFFSAVEVMPFLLSNRGVSCSPETNGIQPRALAFLTFGLSCFSPLLAAGTFLGAGIFGFLINLPIVSYYEIGTALAANHGHASMMGVYGMPAVGLALFCLRYNIPEKSWSDRAAKLNFWSLNIGLAWMDGFCHCSLSACFSSTIP